MTLAERVAMLKIFIRFAGILHITQLLTFRQIFLSSDQLAGTVSFQRKAEKCTVKMSFTDTIPNILQKTVHCGFSCC